MENNDHCSRIIYILSYKIVKKLEDLGMHANITGIEVCNYHEKYFREYQLLNPLQIKSFDRVDAVFDNFFTTEKLPFKAYDLIILPMNTFPSFPIQGIKQLFEKVKDYLTEDGYFLFSTYKTPENISLEYFKAKFQRDHGAEILIGDDELLVSEYIQLYHELMDWGVYSREYHSINSLSREYKLINRGVFQNQSCFINRLWLHQLIKDQGYTISIFDESSHSAVYGVQLN